MKINRITFSCKENFPEGGQGQEFNKLVSYYEELIFNFLPKNTEIGGYGFLHTKFDLENNEANWHAYGQIIDVFQPILRSDLSDLLNSSIEHQVYFLGQQLKSVLARLENQISVDSQIFHEVIEKVNATYAGFEKELRVSKNHPSRKIKVAITRVVQPTNEFIICRIRNKKGETLDEFKLSNNSSIYDVSNNFSKSKWSNDKLLIYNRFDEVKQQIEVTKYLQKST